MIIYNTTFHIDGERHVARFLAYLRDSYYPAVTSHDAVRNPRIIRIVTSVGEDTFAYALMFEAESIRDLKRWKSEVGQKAEADLHAHFGQKVLAFSTLMKDVTTQVNKAPEDAAEDEADEGNV